MRKKTIGILFIVSIVIALVGVGLIIAGAAGGTYTSNPYGGSQMQNLGNPGLFFSGVVLAWASGIVHLVAWIGALVNLARLQYWGWFVFMLLFSTITLIVYLIAGPTTRRDAPQYAPGPNYPPQPPQYPQS